MTLVFVILPVSLAIAAGFVIAFAIATKRGQFDDLRTPGMRVLFDDDEK
jgi:cbb3-type cytochrome oxidase maturation protein